MNIFSSLDQSIENIRKKMTVAQLAAFVSALVFGIIAHGYVLFNRLSYHDNSNSLFSLGATYEVNRWGLGIISDLQRLSTKTYAVPVFNGVLSIIIIAVCASLVAGMFKIKSRVAGAMIGAIMCVYPVVTSIFSFMFTSWPYFLALLLSILAAYVYRDDKKYAVIYSAVFLALSLSIYQAFLGVTATLLLLFLLVSALGGNIRDAKAYFLTGGKYLLGLGIGIGLWALSAKVFKTLKGVQSIEYKGWDEGYKISEFPDRLVEALREFFMFRVDEMNSLRYLRILTAAIFVIGIVLVLIRLVRANINGAVKVSSLVGITLLPIGMNIIYLLSTADKYIVDTMMLYADIFVYVLPIIIIDRTDSGAGDTTLIAKISSCLSGLVLICISVITIGYTYYDNGAYLKASMQQEAAVAYFTELVANIKGSENFSDDMPIVFVGMTNLADGTIAEVANNEELDGIVLEKYYDNLLDMLRHGGSISFMRDHIGFGNEKVSEDDDDIIAMKEVQEMPVYPNAGCFKTIDGKLVVKMGEIDD
ncbi:MAG: glucosyltransferase domain-containing protein [Pseudobutyrivibrio sp.]|nr:glucosyltransferase domain-containing protein [Pseudobutyrivibrio sp.]